MKVANGAIRNQLIMVPIRLISIKRFALVLYIKRSNYDEFIYSVTSISN